ncbi:helix-turn-helix domain-containing protein [Arthrobacter sp. SDTb3-6]|uniref:helix-turn-helix domain-containing protein n=1 Tax=Arthrobacter sp. SDTb3-6 TaxID=2713571 RepID=UPI00159EA9FC|nr:helix-turn-helix domain-containing protein [Arthrobacter sp. SDTb3-6]NVM98524.1 helix-turn-helix domain-containing protein [Arthrobacter sp. SDTb3-6]
MTAQPPLPLSMVPAAVPVGLAVSLVEGDRGGEVYIRGQLCDVWDVGDGAARRWAAVKLVRLHAASAAEIAKAFKVSTVALWKWGQLADAGGVAALVAEKKGPKRPSVLVAATIERIVALRGQHRSLRSIAAAVGVSEFSVRRALKIVDEQGVRESAAAPVITAAGEDEPQPPLPVLPVPLARGGERAAARAGLLKQAEPRFAPAARVRHAGLFLAVPALETTGLLACAKATYGSLPDGFYGLETVLVDAVLRALAGEARAEGATRFDPQELGRVLGLDRAPDVKTIRRRISQLAQAGKAEDLIAALAKHHLTSTGPGGADLAAVLYVDGHVRAYQGTKKIGKIYSTRLKFPVPATEETWVTDAQGSPVLVVMAAPAASLASELRRILPELRRAVGDSRRVLVGFDRGGWSPDLFQHMSENGFDVLTWRKGASEDIQQDLFKKVSHTDEHGQERKWSVADTVVELSLATTKTTGEVFPIRQLSRIVPATGGGTRQIHILTTDRTMSAGEAVYRMGARWRQENQFRQSLLHSGMIPLDSYAGTGDDEDRKVTNPAKKQAYQLVVAARARHAEAAAVADVNLLALKSPAEGAGEVTVTSTMHNHAMAPLWEAENALIAAEKTHKAIPAKLRLGDLNPGQQVLDTETKLIHHGIRMAAYNTAMTIAREIRTNTGYKRAAQEAHALARQALNQTGDIDTTRTGYLTITLDPLPTKAKTAAIKELCDHLTATETRYPGTDLTLRYAIRQSGPG